MAPTAAPRRTRIDFSRRGIELHSGRLFGGRSWGSFVVVFLVGLASLVTLLSGYRMVRRKRGEKKSAPKQD